MINIQQFGGVGDGVTDNASAWTKALAALNPHGDRLYFPAGKYLSSISPEFTYPIGKPFALTIDGDGADVTDLYWPASNGIALNASNARHSLHLSDLTMSTGSRGYTALNLINGVAEGNFAQNDIWNVTFRGEDGGQNADGWVTDINLENWSNVNLFNVLIYGAGNGYGNGVVLQSSNPKTPGIVYNFSQCGFFNLGIGISYGSVQGLSISQCNFTNGITGIFSPPGNTNESQLAISDSQFNTSANQIFSLSLIGQLMLTGNLLIMIPGANGLALMTPSGEIAINANGSFPNASAILTGNTFVRL